MNKIQIKKGDFEILVEGDTKFIEKYLSIFGKDLFLEQSDSSKKNTPKDKSTKNEKNDNDSNSSLMSLYEQKKPLTHYDKIALFGYYLSENGKETFTPEDLNSCYLELRKVTKMPGNLDVTIADTIKYTGYIKRSGKKSLTLTSTGMNYVNFQLPTTTK